MKKMLMVLMLMLVGVVGCGQQGISIEDIEKEGTLLVGLSGDYPPFEFYKMIDGKETLVGFDVMLAEKIAEELGVEVEFKNMDFNSLIGALQSGQVDMVISGMSPNETRLKQVDFSDFYYTGENAVLVREDDVAKYQTESDLKDIKIGTQLGSIQTPIAESFTSSVKELSTTQSIVLELSNGNVDAVILGKDIADRYAEEFDNVVVSDVTISSEEAMAVALPKGSDELTAKVNEVIAKLNADGTLGEMLEEAMKIANE